ncbi:MAG: CDP-alcohol phosphatidyltransferase family protein [Bradyrhizobium sp.]
MMKLDAIGRVTSATPRLIPGLARKALSMFDRRLQPLIQATFTAPARVLVASGVTANAVTLVGFLIGLAGACFLASRSYLLALLLLLLNRIFDGLDGAVARLTGPTDRGAFLDVALDFFVYASVPLGFALADPPDNALAACVLLFGFIGTATSFLAFAIIAERRGLSSLAFPQKGIYYLGGVTEGAETIAFFIAMCFLPDWFPVLAWVFAILCFITAATRWFRGWQAFAGSARE